MTHLIKQLAALALRVLACVACGESAVACARWSHAGGVRWLWLGAAAVLLGGCFAAGLSALRVKR